MAKKKETKKSEPQISFHMFEPKKPTINAKTVDALKTLLSDEGFKNEIGHKYSHVVQAFEEGTKHGKKGAK